jgi:hypothetical protein
MCVFLPTVKGLVVFELDHTDTHLTGFHLIHGKDLTQQKNPAKLAIVTGEKYLLQIIVTTTDVTAKINDQLITKLPLNGNSLSTPKHWGEPQSTPFRLGIGSNSQSIFKNTQVKRTHNHHAK